MASNKSHNQNIEKAKKIAEDKIKSKVNNAIHQIGANHPLIKGNIERSKTVKANNNILKSSSVDTPEDTIAGIQRNVLHKFATYNSLFTLSGMSEDELRTQAYLTNPVHDVIARSGGIGDTNVSEAKYQKEANRLKLEQDWYSSLEAKRFGKDSMTYNDMYDPEPSKFILGLGHDLFFENLEMLSTVGPNSERGLANFTKMTFDLVEPFGITFVEKVKAATFINGYRDYQDAPLLLTIEFKGTDEHGKPLASREDQNFLVRKIPILIVRVEFDVEASGARYNIVAVPFGDLAHDDRFKFPRRSLDLSVSSVDEWITEVEEQLDEQMQDEIDEGLREIKDKYEFYVDEQVAERGKYIGEPLQIHQNESNRNWIQRVFTFKDAPPKIELSEAMIDSQTSLVKFFEDAIRTGHGYQVITETFWQYWYLQMKGSINNETLKKSGNSKELLDFFNSNEFKFAAKNNQWIDWFEIKTTVETNKDYDNIRKMHSKSIIFKAIPKRLHVLKFFPPGVSLGFVDWSKYVRKQYNYIYSGENVDIQNMRINYKTAYYMRNLRPFEKDYKEAGDYAKFEKSLMKVFGAQDLPEPTAPVRIEPSIQQGKNTVQSKSNKTQQFYDYITNPQADMIRVELEILGDPAFICQDQFITIHKDRAYKNPKIGNGAISGSFGSFNSENFQPLVEINFVTPTDIDDKGGFYHRHAGAKMAVPGRYFFNGVYQVVKVDSKFKDGTFTQTLHCVRLNQQQGSGAYAITQEIKKDYKSTVTKYTKTEVTEEKVQELQTDMKTVIENKKDFEYDYQRKMKELLESTKK